MSETDEIAKAIAGLFRRLREIEKIAKRVEALEQRVFEDGRSVPSQEELARTIPGGYSDKFEW